MARISARSHSLSGFCRLRSVETGKGILNLWICLVNGTETLRSTSGEPIRTVCTSRHSTAGFVSITCQFHHWYRGIAPRWCGCRRTSDAADRSRRRTMDRRRRCTCGASGRCPILCCMLSVRISQFYHFSIVLYQSSK